jgi:hypothetical protein
LAIQVSKNIGLTDIVSEINPLSTKHPTSGSTLEIRVWIFNDDPTRTYEDITIDPIDATGTDESNWIQLAPDNVSVAGSYGAGGAPLAMPNITTANSGTPFWVKTTTPSGQIVKNKNDIKLAISFTEYAV